MAIEMQTTSNGYGPVLVCDESSERINCANECNVEWAESSSSEPGTRVLAKFLHRGDCVNRNLAKNPDYDNSMHLEVVLPQLIDNLSMDWDNARQWSNEMRIGIE